MSNGPDRNAHVPYANQAHQHKQKRLHTIHSCPLLKPACSEESAGKHLAYQQGDCVSRIHPTRARQAKSFPLRAMQGFMLHIPHEYAVSDNHGWVPAWITGVLEYWRRQTAHQHSNTPTLQDFCPSRKPCRNT